MKENALQLLNQLLPDLLYVLALMVIFYSRSLIKLLLPKVNAWLEAHTTSAQRKMINDLGHEAFAYAETVFRQHNGADKLHEALAYFQKHMDKYGLSNLSHEIIRTAIERAWLADKRMHGVTLTPVVEFTAGLSPGSELQSTPLRATAEAEGQHPAKI